MQWRGAEVEPQVEYPDPDAWRSVEVPGRPASFAGADAVAYRTTIDDPTTATEPYAVLELRGCYAETTVWVDGEAVATHDTYFAPLRVRLDERLDGETDIRVVCRRPTDGFGGLYETDQLPAAETVPGIWWDATVRTYTGPYIDHLYATPQFDGTDGTISVSGTVVATEPLDGRLTFSVRPAGNRRERGMMERASVEAAAGETTTVEHDIQMREPSQWWPSELGAQDRYVVTAKLDGVEKSVTTGFCAVDLRDELVSINGTETSVRGVNLLDATPEDVRMAAEHNANLVRTHAHVPSPDVVRACEEEGVLLWVDLPLTGPQTVDVERGRELATACATNLGHAASLSAVGVHDDPVELFERPLGSGWLDRLRYRWRTWRASFDDSTATAIGESIPESLATFPVVGPPGIDADATTLYPGWQYGSVDDLSWVLDRLPDVDAVAEFGAGALGVTDVEERAGFDQAVHEYHTQSGDVEQSQRYQARVVKRVAEGLRTTGVPVVALYALRDTGDAGMGVLDNDGNPKAAAAALERAYEPVQATLADPTGETSDVVVHNALGTRFTGELRWESQASSGTTEVTIDTNARARVATIDLPDAGSVTLQLSTADRTVENTYER